MRNSGVTMAGEIRILMLEDDPSDAKLVERELRRAGMQFVAMRVESRDAYVEALESYKPDIVLADYKLPAFDGLSAVNIARDTHPDIPVIMVTGALGDEGAVELLHAGAKDYVLKDRLARLGPAVLRALAAEEASRNRRLAEEKYRALLNEATDGILLIDSGTGQVVECNPEFERQTGRSLAQLRTLKLWELLPRDQREAARQRLLEIEQAGSGRDSSFGIEHISGSIIPVEYSARFFKIQDQGYIQAITRDISERLRAEQTLRESEARYKRITEGLTDYQYTVHMQDGRPVSTVQGPACVKVTGYTAEELARNTDLWLDMVVPEDRPRVLERGRQVLAGNSVPPIEHRITRKDGTIRWVSDTIILFKDAEGRLLSYDGVIRDITERKQTDQELQRINRALLTIRACNQVLIHADEESRLLDSTCEIIVENAGYMLVWIGFADPDDGKRVRPVTHAGLGGEYVERPDVTWDETARGQGPTGRAIRLRTPQVVSDTLSDPSYLPWRDHSVTLGYRSVLALPLVFPDQVLGALTIYSAHRDDFSDQEIRLLAELADDLAFGILTLRNRQLQEQGAARLLQSMEDSIAVMAGTMEIRDPYTAGHQRRVADLTKAMGEELGLPEDEIHGIYLAALIHDLGKIQVPAEMLAKPARLTDMEMAMIQIHPQAGYDILKEVDFPWPIALIVYQHHERLDGSGYPQKLKEPDIVFGAKILAVADTVEAMSSHRPYRPALGIDAALGEITETRGSRYDARAVDACLRVFREKGYKFPASK